MAKHALFVKSMWYVVRTEPGKEQTFVETIEKTIKHRSYRRCFFIKRERIRRKQGECRVYKELLYPEYVFLDTEDPEDFCRQISELPQLVEILGTGRFNMQPVDERERRFWTELLDGEEKDTIRLSPVQVNEDGELVECGGVLKKFHQAVIKKRIRNRYVIVRTGIEGRDRDILLGIRVIGKD